MKYYFLNATDSPHKQSYQVDNSFTLLNIPPVISVIIFLARDGHASLTRSHRDKIVICISLVFFSILHASGINKIYDTCFYVLSHCYSFNMIFLLAKAQCYDLFRELI